jgi:hypothetical protein
MKNIVLLLSMIVCFGGATKKTSATGPGTATCEVMIDSVVIYEEAPGWPHLAIYGNISIQADQEYVGYYPIIEVITTSTINEEDTLAWALEEQSGPLENLTFMTDFDIHYWYPGEPQIMVGIQVGWFNFSITPPLVEMTYSGMIPVDIPWIVTSSEDLEEASEKISDLNVYPNPTRGPVTINGIRDVDEELFVYDMLGKQVLRASLADSQNSQMNLSLDGLKSGLYSVVAVSKENRRVLRLEVQ